MHLAKVVLGTKKKPKQVFCRSTSAFISHCGIQKAEGPFGGGC